MKKFISIFTALQIILTAFNIACADYYVTTNGSDANPGTLTQPWKTVQKAADTAEPDVREGVYNGQVTINVSGSDTGGYIIFRNYEGETPVLDGEGFDVHRFPLSVRISKVSCVGRQPKKALQRAGQTCDVTDMIRFAVLGKHLVYQFA